MDDTIESLRDSLAACARDLAAQRLRADNAFRDVEDMRRQRDRAWGDVAVIAEERDAVLKAEVAQAVDQRNQALRELEEARDYVGRELLAARAEVTALRLEAEAAVNMRETFSRTLEENVALRALLVIGLERCDCPLGACATFCNPTRAFLDGRRDDAPLTYKADGVYRGTERLRLARDEGSRELDCSGEPLAVGDSRDYRVTAEDTWCHKCQSWTCPCPEGRVPRPPERFRMRDEARCTCRHRTSEDRIAGHFKGCPARDEGGAP